MTFFAVVFSVFVVGCYGFGYQDCMPNGRSNPNNVIHVNSAHISPSNVVIPGDVTVNVNVAALQHVEGPMKLSVQIKRELAFGLSVTIPCVSDIGSCEYDLCSLLNNFNSTNCPAPLLEDHFPCMCPFNPGTYNLDNAHFNIPELSGILSWLTAGNYHIKASLTDGAGVTRGCHTMDITIASKCSGFGCLFG